MMDTLHLQDRIARGLGHAAQHIGDAYDVFRAKSAAAPLSQANRVLRLSVALHGEDRDWHRSARYGQPLWFAVLDTSYTQPGDYLSGPGGIFFIAAQPALLPTVCVLTNRTISVTRAAGADAIGINAYGGIEPPTQIPILTDWPASLLAGTGGTSHGGALPGEPGPATWTILLPDLPPDVMTDLRGDDLVQDETGLIAVITSAEHSMLGWRLTASQAVT